MAADTRTVEEIEHDAIDRFYSSTLEDAQRRVAMAEKLRAAEASLRERAEAHAAALLENLTAVQARCTELLNSSRLAGILERQPGDSSAFLALAWNLERARLTHPNGPDGMRSLAEEVGEVASAIRREPLSSVRSELLDVAAVALRLWIGEHPDGALSPATPESSEGDAADEDDSSGERTSRSTR